MAFDEVAGDAEGAEGAGDALGPRAQASGRGWAAVAAWCERGCSTSVRLAAAAAGAPAHIRAPRPLPAPAQIINTACWQSSKECGLLLGALARALPIGGEQAQPGGQCSVCGGTACTTVCLHAVPSWLPSPRATMRPACLALHTSRPQRAADGRPAVPHGRPLHRLALLAQAQRRGGQDAAGLCRALRAVRGPLAAAAFPPAARQRRAGVGGAAACPCMPPSSVCGHAASGAQSSASSERRPAGTPRRPAERRLLQLADPALRQLPQRCLAHLLAFARRPGQGRGDIVRRSGAGRGAGAGHGSGARERGSLRACIGGGKGVSLSTSPPAPPAAGPPHRPRHAPPTCPTPLLCSRPALCRQRHLLRGAPHTASWQGLLNTAHPHTQCLFSRPALCHQRHLLRRAREQPQGAAGARHGGAAGHRGRRGSGVLAAVGGALLLRMGWWGVGGAAGLLGTAGDAALESWPRRALGRLGGVGAGEGWAAGHRDGKRPKS